MKISRNMAITFVCIILGAMLAWQFKSINYNQVQATSQNKRQEVLMQELIALQKTTAELRTRLQELQEEKQVLENSQNSSDQAAAMLKQGLQQARVFAGMVPVKGKGIIITLDDSEYNDVYERDILDIVNELRAAGAQAISVNEERIVSMSEIREAGRYIMVNGTPMEAPFTIKAIAPPDKLERSLLLLGGIIENLENFLKIDIKKSDEIYIPAVRDDGSVIKTDMLTPVE